MLKCLTYRNFHYLCFIIQMTQNNQAMTTEQITLALAKGKMVTVKGYGSISLFLVSGKFIKIETLQGSFHRFHLAAMDFFMRQTTISK